MRIIGEMTNQIEKRKLYIKQTNIQDNLKGEEIDVKTIGTEANSC